MPRRAGKPRWNDPGLLILASLSGGPKHGYAMTQDIEVLFGIAIGPGTLYGAISRLEEHGYIEPLGGDDRRRPYRLTARGGRFLAEQSREMSDFAALTRKRMSRAPAPQGGRS